MKQEKGTPDDIIGVSEHIKKVRRRIIEAAAGDANVLIQGDTGTGKELIAKAIHYSSQRRQNRFVDLDCGTIPPDLFESSLFGHVQGAFTGAMKDKAGLVEVAHGGTLLLDEVGNLSPDRQAKLLRFLQERRFRRVGGDITKEADVRIIAATNIDLSQAVQKKTFREDLYYRLEGAFIDTEPLANRPEDVVCLVRHFMRKEGLRAATDVGKMKFLLYSYNFPGNVRELERLIIEGGNYERVRTKLQRNTPQLMEELHSAMERLSPNQIKEIVEAYEIIIPRRYTKLSQRDLARRLGIKRDHMQPGYFKERFNFELPPRDEKSPLWTHPMRLCTDFMTYMGNKIMASDKA